MAAMTALGVVGRQVRWSAAAFALLDLLVTAYVVLARVPLADPLTTWALGAAAAGATFTILTGVGVGLQLAGDVLAERGVAPIAAGRPTRPTR